MSVHSPGLLGAETPALPRNLEPMRHAPEKPASPRGTRRSHGAAVKCGSPPAGQQDRRGHKTRDSRGRQSGQRLRGGRGTSGRGRGQEDGRGEGRKREGRERGGKAPAVEVSFLRSHLKDLHASEGQSQDNGRLLFLLILQGRGLWGWGPPCGPLQVQQECLWSGAPGLGRGSPGSDAHPASLEVPCLPPCPCSCPASTWLDG